MNMNYKSLLLCLLLQPAGLFSASAQGNAAPHGLLTNLLAQPELSVLTSLEPKFSWEVPTTDKNDYQTAYQIFVASTPALLDQDKPDLWNSGKMISNHSTHIRYAGKTLQSGTSCFWKVVTWNKNGEASEASTIQQFNIGDAARTKSWPGESLWIQVAQPDGSKRWSFEDRHPITYHAAYPVDSHRKKNGTWFIDFNQAAFSNVSLTLQWNARPEEKQDTLITIRIGEKSIGDSIDAKPGGGVIYREYPLRIQNGTAKYNIEIPRFKPHYPHSQAMPEHMVEVIPFRYCEVVGKELNLSLVSAEQMRLYTRFDENASYFRSADPLLNDIYNFCRYSVIANTFNGDYAASQRERMMYEADAYIHQMGHYAVDREFATARFSLENMIYHATWPTEWISHSIMMVWMDYLHTGDIDVIKKNYTDIQPKLMLALTMPNGLISTRTGLVTEAFCHSIFYKGKELKDIVDWPWGSMSSTLKGGETDDYQFEDYNTVVNAFHYHTLVLMEKMALAIGKKEDARSYAKRHTAFYKKFQQYFFDEEQGIYTDGITTKHASLHANLYPLAFGLVPEKQKATVVNYIKTKEMACGVYSANYLLEGLFDAGEGDYAMRLLTAKSDRSWYNMLHVGATMTTEAWDNKYKTNNGWSHAWSSSPAHILPRKVMGIEPIEPGFSRVRIKPQPSGLPWAEAKLPTIRGEIVSSFRVLPNGFSLSVSCPANIVSDIYLPVPKGVRKYTVLHNGVPVENTKVKDGYIVLPGIPSGKHTFELNE